MSNMSLDALELFAQKLKQLTPWPDNQEVFINARDLVAFGVEVPEGTPPGRPMPITVGALRALTPSSPLPEIDDGCEGCQ